MDTEVNSQTQKSKERLENRKEVSLGRVNGDSKEHGCGCLPEAWSIHADVCEKYASLDSWINFVILVIYMQEFECSL